MVPVIFPSGQIRRQRFQVKQWQIYLLRFFGPTRTIVVILFRADEKKMYIYIFKATTSLLRTNDKIFLQFLLKMLNYRKIFLYPARSTKLSPEHVFELFALVLVKKIEQIECDLLEFRFGIVLAVLLISYPFFL